MATEVNPALAAYAQGLFDQAAGRGQQAIDQVQADLDEFARLLVHQVRLRKALADPGLPPEPKRALLADLGQGRLEEAAQLLQGLEQHPDAVRTLAALHLALGELAGRQSRGAFRARRAGPAGEAVLDPTGVVKGWAVERAADHLRALEATDFCLSAGGDMVCRTLDRDAPPWRIGIEDPHHTDRLVAVAPVHTGAVATSGTAHRGDHLVDARTGRPPAGVASVTVVAASLTWADIDATAAYAHGRDAARWLRTRPGRSGLVVWSDGSTTLVDGPAPITA